MRSLCARHGSCRLTRTGLFLLEAKQACTPGAHVTDTWVYEALDCIQGAWASLITANEFPLRSKPDQRRLLSDYVTPFFHRFVERQIELAQVEAEGDDDDFEGAGAMWAAHVQFDVEASEERTFPFLRRNKI